MRQASGCVRVGSILHYVARRKSPVWEFVFVCRSEDGVISTEITNPKVVTLHLFRPLAGGHFSPMHFSRNYIYMLSNKFN